MACTPQVYNMLTRTTRRRCSSTAVFSFAESAEVQRVVAAVASARHVWLHEILYLDRALFFTTRDV